MNTKHYTSIEQSKKLLELGLNPETADMWWTALNWQETEYEAIPCWSIAALLSIIPNYKLSSEHNYHTCTAETSFGKETVAWFDNPVDACYEMILKLHELNLL